jgi:hypothetical protein
MAYGNYNRGNYGGGNGGYQQNNYNNGGGYQKPAPQPVDINAEINARIDLFLQIQEAIKARGLDPTEFAFAVGGWTTSLILEQKKGK